MEFNVLTLNWYWLLGVLIFTKQKLCILIWSVFNFYRENLFFQLKALSIEKEIHCKWYIYIYINQFYLSSTNNYYHTEKENLPGSKTQHSQAENKPLEMEAEVVQLQHRPSQSISQVKQLESLYSMGIHKGKVLAHFLVKIDVPSKNSMSRIQTEELQRKIPTCHL